MSLFASRVESGSWLDRPTALALARPDYFASLSCLCRANNGQSSKDLASQIVCVGVKRHQISRVEKLWPGETFVVIGGGSSLTAADCNYVRGKARVIGIKEAAVTTHQNLTAPAPWADALYAADYKWWKFEKGAPGFTGLKYTIEEKPGEPMTVFPGVQLLRNTGEDGLETDPTGLRTGFNSGYQAINLAVHLGAAKVVLLGFDCWRGPTGQQNWFGQHPAHTESTYPVFLQAFSSIVEPLKAAGVEVINCSRFTVLQAFPRMPLEEALP